MVTLTKQGLQNDEAWKKLGIDNSVKYRIEDIVRATRKNPQWVQIAPSNLFIGEIAPIAEDLGFGIIGFETHDEENVSKIYKPHDNLRLRVVMPPTGDNRISIIGNIADVLYSDSSNRKDWVATRRYVTQDSLQLITVTCTEKGYSIGNEIAERDMARGPEAPQHLMAKVAAMAYDRLIFGKGHPIAFVSMDNCSRNGEKFKNAVLDIARAWSQKGYLQKDLVGYLESDKVSFPWTMIDRITPRPSEKVLEQLAKMGIEGMEAIETAKHTFASAAVNTEHISYLVIQDLFPNGRPKFETADYPPNNRVIMVDGTDTIDKIEKMKVGTCLNPIHTTLAISGVVLGYSSIAAIVSDPLIKKWVYKQAYDEGLPKVVNPGVIDPEVFLKQVLEERLPNANIVDTPQRIATDTSQKIAPRYGGTIKAYDAEAGNLTYIPLAIAMWCRYLAGATKKDNDNFYGVDDKGQEIKLSPDPMMEQLSQYTYKLDPRKEISGAEVHQALRPILSDEKICGLDLYKVGLGKKIEDMTLEMLKGAGAVKRTIEKYVMRGE